MIQPGLPARTPFLLPLMAAACLATVRMAAAAPPAAAPAAPAAAIQTATSAAMTEESLKALETLVSQDQSLLPYLLQIGQTMQKQPQTQQNPFTPLAAPAIPAQTSPQNGNAMSGFRQGSPAPGLPALRLKGVIQGRRGQKMALLEIGGVGTFMVKEGDYVGLQQVNTNGSVLHIKRITPLNVVVETGASEQAMVVQ